MMDVGRHPNITLLTYSEVEEVSGYIGNFTVKIRKKARYVDEDLCTACEDCLDVCPVAVPDEFQMGFASRKAIYMPFPQAVPSTYLIDIDSCLGNFPLACGECADVCEPNAIDYDMKDEIVEVEVGSIIATPGIEMYDPTEHEEYGYTKYENVLTSMEFERLMGPTGPVDGDIIRPSDRKMPKTVGFIQCVGSRSKKKGNPYCSNICCMNTVKETLLLSEYSSEIQSKVFYMDMRTFGKGFEDFLKRSKEEGTIYIRGIPGMVEEDPATKNLILTVENTSTGNIEQHEVEMVVLATGITPREDTRKIREILSLTTNPDGFLMEQHAKLKPVEAPTAGVFLAGCAESPKDVRESVQQAGAAAAKAQILMGRGKVKVEAITASVDPEKCTICGICADTCPYSAITVDVKNRIPAKVIEAACHGCGACSADCPFDAITMKHFTDEQLLAMVDSHLEVKPKGKIIVFACNWCSYAGADFAGISRYRYPDTCRVIRTMCSGRVDEKFVLRALELGAPIVLVSGCHYADCKYINANRRAQLRVEKLWNKLERLGIRPERLQLEWIAASEGARFAKVMKELEEMRQQVTMEEIDETMDILKKEREKKEARERKKKEREKAKEKTEEKTKKKKS
jgi:heterodisulfide reductase subunit A